MAKLPRRRLPWIELDLVGPAKSSLRVSEATACDLDLVKSILAAKLREQGDQGSLSASARLTDDQTLRILIGLFSETYHVAEYMGQKGGAA